jgi:anti-sigma B factor antagonist
LASEQAPVLTVREHWDGRVAIAVVEGEIDLSTVSIFSDHLGHLAAANPRQLIIDLAAVSFIDSSGLTGLIRLSRALPAGCPVVIRSPQRRVWQVFTITGLDTAFILE